MRTAVHWLSRLYIALRPTDDERDDAIDWLAGNDTAVVARRNQRARDAVLAAGGELG